MTIATIITITERIKVATPRSPIAVFRVANQLDAIFAAPLGTLERIKTDPSLVGVFDGTEDGNEVYRKLRSALKD